MQSSVEISAPLGHRRIRASKTGSDHQRYLNSDRWQKLRLEAFEFHGSNCADCRIPRWLAKIAYDQDLNVHHESYANIGTDGELYDLQILCRRCHELVTYGRTDIREPKAAICEICRGKHWNPWGNKCEACRKVTEDFGGEGIERFFMNLTDESLGPGITIGESFMHFLISRRGVDAVLEDLIKFENFRKSTPKYDLCDSDIFTGEDGDVPF